MLSLKPLSTPASQAKLFLTFSVFLLTPAILLLLLLTNPYSLGILDSTQRRFLNAQNAARRKHCDPPLPALTWNRAAYSSSLIAAKTCTFAHGQSGEAGAGFGENLCSGHATLEDCVEAWYNEIDDPGYDFQDPGFAFGTGHFTQVVWKDTTSVGCAICEESKIYVCQYDPPGNVIGGYEENVFEPAACGIVDDPKTLTILIGSLVGVALLSIYVVLLYKREGRKRDQLQSHCGALGEALGLLAAKVWGGVVLLFTHDSSPFGVFAEPPPPSPEQLREAERKKAERSAKAARDMPVARATPVSVKKKGGGRGWGFSLPSGKGAAPMVREGGGKKPGKLKIPAAFV
ncbi:hypothetical protein TeGR_g13245 [Tetraparma gracilis]|uniref:SCP domain-containing protein n=1 Tax=Tetraparma gracilis TaxID=2962635 RepID=A0ABQ6N1D1_9STRA|nr:hypothetical protein TeGR_g13245 [Tetraparma gracilis]